MTPAALVVVDVQQAYLDHDPAPYDVAGLLQAVRVLAASARAASALVVHVQDVGDADPRFPLGGGGRGLVLDVLDGEPVVAKSDDDAFVGTSLGDHLAGVSAVVVAGVQSEMCVAATARGALTRGIGVVLPQDAHSTWDVPAGPDGPAVPAELVRRVAAWSLGDDVYLPARAADVRFVGPTA